MPRLRVAALTAIAATLLAETAPGQLRGALDLGAGTYRPDRAIPGGVASIAPTLAYDGGWFRVGASGIYSDAPAGRWNFQGSTLAQLRSPQLGPLQLEGTGQVDVTRHFHARGATVASTELRGYLRPFAGGTLWAGRIWGSARTLGAHRPLSRSLVGASARVRGVEIGFAVTSSTFDLMGTVDRGAAPREDSLAGVPTAPQAGDTPTTRRQLTDAILSSRWRLAETDIDLAVGRRFGRNTPELTIWGVSASRGIAPNLAVIAGAGRAGSDPVTAVPGARYLVMGLRLKVGGATTPVLPATPISLEQAPFRIGPALPAGREIVVRVPGASSVELAGDFTDWQPVALQPEGNGGWRAVLPIKAGLQRFAIRVNGGAWQAPAGTRAIRNEFGAEVAEIVVD